MGMINNQQIICFSTQDWDDLWTRKHRFMFKFSEQDNKVLYIEQQMHWLGYLKNFKQQWRRIYLWLKGSRQINKNLYIFTLPPVIPFFQVFPLINKINNWLIAWLVKKQAKNLGLKMPILWFYTPHGADMIGKFNERAVIYECVDEFSASKGLLKAEVVVALEHQLMRKANLVIVTAKALYDSKKGVAKNIHLIPNAAEVEHFSKCYLPITPIAKEMTALRKPIIGFLGAVEYWVDIELIKFIALAKPEWSIVFVGPVRIDVSKVSALPNVFFLGRKDYQRLPQYLMAFDVCLNPYIMDGVAEGCSPLKLYEYLASGKPIVSVAMPESLALGKIVENAYNKEEFLKNIEKVLSTDNPEAIKRRLAEAKNHSWEQRFKLVEENVSLMLAGKR